MKRLHKIGDTVISLNSNTAPSQPRTKGVKYKVTDIFHCPTNGDQMINIDNTPASGETGYMKCTCGSHHKIPKKLGYTLSELFINMNDLDKELKLAIANEDYQTAIIIRDIRRNESCSTSNS